MFACVASLRSVMLQLEHIGLESREHSKEGCREWRLNREEWSLLVLPPPPADA